MRNGYWELHSPNTMLMHYLYYLTQRSADPEKWPHCQLPSTQSSSSCLLSTTTMHILILWSSQSQDPVIYIMQLVSYKLHGLPDSPSSVSPSKTADRLSITVTGVWPSQILVMQLYKLHRTTLFNPCFPLLGYLCTTSLELN